MATNSGNIIFVHINKCAGSSIKKALGWEPLRDHKDIYCIRRSMHVTVFKHAFKFAVIRNPFDRLVSRFHYRKSRGNLEGLSFVNWFYRAVVFKEEPLYTNPLMFAPCYDWISEDGEILVDKILLFSRLEEQWEELRGRLWADPLPRLNVGNYDKEQEYYDEEMREHVYEIYEQDFKLISILNKAVL